MGYVYIRLEAFLEKVDKISLRNFKRYFFYYRENY